MRPNQLPALNGKVIRFQLLLAFLVLLLFSLQVSAQVTWVGTNSGQWTDAANWSPAIVPGASTDVIIQTAPNDPVFTGNRSVKSLTINSGTLNLLGSGNVLSVLGNVSINGGVLNMGADTLLPSAVLNLYGDFRSFVGRAGFQHGRGTVTFQGPGSRFVSASGQSVRFWNLIVNIKGRDTIQLQDTLWVNKKLTMRLGQIKSKDTAPFTLGKSIVDPNSGSDSSFITGPVVFYTPRSYNIKIPLGRSGKYRPLGMFYFNGVNDAFKAEYWPVGGRLRGFPTDSVFSEQNELCLVDSFEHWTLKRLDVNTPGVCKVVLPFNTGSVIGEDVLKVAMWQEALPGKFLWRTLGGTAVSQSGKPFGTVTSDIILPFDTVVNALALGYQAPLPTPFAQDDSTCTAINGTARFTLRASGIDAVINWYASDTATRPFAIGKVAVINISQPTTIYMEYTVGKCRSPRGSLFLKPIYYPQLPAVPDTIYRCDTNQIVNLKFNMLPNLKTRFKYEYTYNYDLTLPGPLGLFAIPATSDSSGAIRLSKTAKVFLNITSKDNKCNAPSPATFIVKVVPDPPAPTAVDAFSCLPDTLTLRVKPRIGSPISRFKWYTSRTGSDTLAGITGDSLRAFFPTSDTFYVAHIVSDQGCEGFRQPVKAVITGFPLVGPTVQLPVDSICDSGSITIRTTSVQDSLALYADSTSLVPLKVVAGNAIRTPGYEVNTVFWLGSITRVGCPSKVRTKVLAKIAPDPVAINLPDTTICGPGLLTLVPKTAVKGGQYTWWLSPTGGQPIPNAADTFNTQVVVNTIYYVSYISPAGCVLPRKAIRVTVGSQSMAPSATGLTVCANSKAVLRATGAQNGERYFWFDTTNATTPIALTDSLVITSASRTKTYYVAKGTLTCKSQLVPVTLTVTPPPQAPNAVGDTICAGNTAVASVVITGPGNQYRFYDRSTAGSLLATNFDGRYTSPPLTQTDTVYVEVLSFAGCTSARVPAVLLVQPPPQAPQVRDTTLCQPQVFTLTASGLPTGTSYQLFLQQTGGNAFQQSATGQFSVQAVATTTYYIGALLGTDCFSARVPVTVTVSSPPAQPVTIASRRCGPGPVTARISGLGTGLQAQWFATTTGPVVTTTTSDSLVLNVAGDTTIYVALSNGNCSSVRVPLVINVDAVPSAPITADTSFCNSLDSLTLTAAGATNGQRYQWFANATGTGTPLVTNTTGLLVLRNPVAAGAYTVRVVNATGCQSAFATANVRSELTPSAPTTADTTICQTGLVTLKAGVVAGNGNYYWYNTAIGGSFIAITNTPQLGLTVTSNQSVFVAFGNQSCQSNRSAINISVAPAPTTAPVAYGDTLCGTGNPVVTFRKVQGATRYLVYDSQTGAVVLASNTDTTVSVPGLSGSTTLYASYAFGACESPRLAVSIGIGNIAGPPVATGVTYCNAPDSVVLVATGATTGQFYQWFNTATGGTALVTNTTGRLVLRNVTGSATYYAALVTNLGCTSTRVPATVQAGSAPLPPTVADTAFCGTTATLTLTARNVQAGTTVNWYATATALTPLFSSSTVTTFTFNATGATTLYVTTSLSSTCESARQPLTITPRSQPVAPIAFNAQGCVGANAIIQFVAGVQTNEYRLYDALNATTPIQTNATGVFTIVAPPTSRTYYGTYLVGNCESARGQVIMVVSPFPAAPIPVTAALCGNVTVATLRATGGSGSDTYMWYDSPTAITPLAITSTGNFSVNNVVLPATYYVALRNSAGCEGPRAVLSVIAEPATVNPQLITDTTVCNNSSLTLTILNQYPAGTVFNWYGSPSKFPIIQTGQQNSFNLVVSGNRIIYVTAQTANGCESNLIAINVRGVNAPIGAPQVANTTACIGNAAVVLINNFNASFTYKLYTTPNGGLPIATANAQGRFILPPGTGITTYWVGVSLGACQRTVRSAFTVSFVAKPARPAIAVAPYSCQAGITNATVQNVPIGSTVIWLNRNRTIVSSSTSNSASFFSAVGDSVFVYFAAGSGCTSDTVGFRVRSGITPNAPLTRDTVSCNRQISLRARSNVAGPRSFIWRDIFGAQLATSDSVLNVFVTANQTTYSVSVLPLNGCTSAVATIRVTIVNNIPKPLDSTLNLCGGAPTVTIGTTASPLDTLFRWYNTQTGGASIATTRIPRLSVIGGVPATYYVASVRGDCEGPRAAVSVRFSPAGSLPIIGSIVSACSNGGIASIPVNNYQGAGLVLYDVPTGGVPIQTVMASRINYTPPASGDTVYISQNIQCPGPRQRVILLPGVLPSGPTGSRDTTLCSNQSLQLQLGSPINSPVQVIGYNWYQLVNGVPFRFSFTSIPRQIFNQSTVNDTILVASVGVNSCESNRVRIIIRRVFAPVVDVRNASVCSGQQANLSVQNPQPGVTYKWFNSQGTLLTTGNTYQTPPITTSETFTIEGSNGTCSTIDLASVFIVSPPRITNYTQSSVCDSGVVIVSLNIAGPAPFISVYDALAGGNLVTTASGTTQFSTPFLRNSVTYWVVVRDPISGCESARQQISVNISRGSIAEAGRDSTICPNRPYPLQGNVVPPFRTVFWSIISGVGGTLINPNLPTASFVGQPNQVYRLRYTIPSTGNCPVSFDEVLLTTLDPTPVITANNPNQFCQANNVVLNASGANPGEYRWLTSNLTPLQERNGQLNLGILTPGVYTYWVEAIRNNCASNRVQVTFNVGGIYREAYAGPDTVICVGNSIVLRGAAVPLPSRGQWTIVNGFGGSFTDRNNATTTFTGQIGQPYLLRWTVLNTGGCANSSDDVAITFQPVINAPTLQTSSTSVCSTEPVTITASGSTNGTYAWYQTVNGNTTRLNLTGNTLILPPQTQINSPTAFLFNVAATTSTCEGVRAPITIVVNPTVTVNAGQDQTVFTELPLQLAATVSQSISGLTYSWTVVSGPATNVLTNANTARPIFKAAPEGQYVLRVTVTTANGCITTDEVVVNVASGIKIYNGFTPNKDGKNERWNIKNIGLYPQVRVKIFNRWNELVFESDEGYTSPWDGTYGGSPAAAGGYTYQITLVPGSDPVIGTLTLIR